MSKKPQQSRISASDLAEQMFWLYTPDTPQTTIAKELGRHRMTVKKAAEILGWPTAPRGRRTGTKFPPHSPRVKAVIEYIEKNPTLSYNDIGAEFGISGSAVALTTKRHNVNKPHATNPRKQRNARMSSLTATFLAMPDRYTRQQAFHDMQASSNPITRIEFSVLQSRRPEVWAHINWVAPANMPIWRPEIAGKPLLSKVTMRGVEQHEKD